jgi:Kef-type K+ transport system membrane component KefB
VLAGLREIGTAGVVLFLVGLARHLLPSRTGDSPRGIGWMTVGAFVVPSLLGGALAWWLLLSGDAGLRGSRSTFSFVLMVVVALSVTAVPVLARIINERALDGTLVARIGMSTAVLIDVAAWLLLGVALSADNGGLAATLMSALVLAGGFGLAMMIRRLLSMRPTRWAGRFPLVTAALLGVFAIVTATMTGRAGLTEVIGAILAGLAIPHERRWTRVVNRVSWAGRKLMPVFFVLAGVGVFTEPLTRFPWLVFVVATALAIVGKVGGGYLGARLGGQSHDTALTLGVLLNTRGLTEIVVLQAGYSAGILSSSLFLALLAMALLTTALTGPLLTLLGAGTDTAAPGGREPAMTLKEH